MDVSKLILDPEYVKSVLVKKGNKRIAKVPMMIMIPSRFVQARLANIGSDVFIAGIYAIVTEDGRYARSMVPAMIQIRPIKTTKTKVNGVEYLVFHFEPGSEVIANTTLVKYDLMVYYVFTEIIAKANIPWQMTYEDHATILEQSAKYAGPTLGNMVDVFSILTATLSRRREDRNIQYRHELLNYEQINLDSPAFIPIRSIQYAVGSTMTRLGGSFFGEGTISALNNPTEKIEPIEAIILDRPLTSP